MLFVLFRPCIIVTFT